MMFLLTLGLCALTEDKEEFLDLDDVDLQMIPPFVFDWINQGFNWLSSHAPQIGEWVTKGYNWVLGHGPQIMNYLQNKINNIPITETVKAWVKNNVGRVVQQLFNKVKGKAKTKKMKIMKK